MAAKVYAAASYANWKQKATADAKQKGLEELARWQDGSSYASERLVEIQNIWNECDVNGDGKMDQAEFAVFHQRLQEQEAQRGTYVEPIENVVERTYQLYNSYDPSTDGFVYQDWITVTQIVMKFYEEARA